MLLYLRNKCQRHINFKILSEPFDIDMESVFQSVKIVSLHRSKIGCNSLELNYFNLKLLLNVKLL